MNFNTIIIFIITLPIALVLLYQINNSDNKFKTKLVKSIITIITTIAITIITNFEKHESISPNIKDLETFRIKGDNNIIINGNGYIINDKAYPEIIDYSPASFYDALIKYDGKTIYIEQSIPSFELNGDDSHLKQHDSNIYYHPVKDINYIFSDGTFKGTYVKGTLDFLEMNLLWPINGKGIFEENDLYDINLGVENLKIETCSKNTKSIQYRHGVDIPFNYGH